MQRTLRLNVGSKSRKDRSVCEFCKATFKRPEYLTRHKRSHTLERPFHCPTCPSKFARKDLLLRHQKICRGIGAKSGKFPKSSIDLEPIQVSSELLPVDSAFNVISAKDSYVQGPSFNCNIDGEIFSQISLNNYEDCATPEAENPKEQSNTVVGFSLHGDQYDIQSTNALAERRPYVGDVIRASSFSRAAVADFRCGIDISNYESSKVVGTLLSTELPFSDAFLPRSTRCIDESGLQFQERFMSILSDSCPASMKSDVRCLQHYPLRKYLEAFAVSLHRHMPIIHNHSLKVNPLLSYLSSFDTSSNHLPLASSVIDGTHWIFHVILVLSMCAIGALHCLEKDKARILRNCGQKMIESYDSFINPCELKDDSLTFIQAKFLCWYYDVWSGDLRYFAHAIQEEPFFVQCCSIGSVNRRARSVECWQDWICTESFHRLLWAIYIVLSDMGIAYNRHVPVMMADVCLPFPESDSLWNATTEDEWKSKIIETPQPPNFQDVMAFVLFGSNSSCHEMPDKSDFFIYVVSHCVINHIQAVITVFHWGDKGNQNCEIGDLKNIAWGQMERIIDRFTLTYISNRPKLDSSPFALSPHLFNASSVRHASIFCQYRVHGPLKNMLAAPQFDSRLNNVISAFLDSPIQSGPLTNRAVYGAMEILQGLMNTGYLSMRWFASSYCSLEHALCAWNGILVLAHWLHRMETVDNPENVNEQELEILTKILDVLRKANAPLETGIDNYGIFRTVTSLAGATIDLWGSVLGDLQVWEGEMI